MTDGSPSLALVMMRFPKHRESIGRLYRTSESFQSLCDDYRDCLAAIESCGEQETFYRDELQELLSDLEEEIVWYSENDG